MTTETKIILPKSGIITNKEGVKEYGRLPYEFTFTTKEEYLAWKKVWKHTYKELSNEIREHKKLRNEGNRKGDSSGSSHASAVMYKKEPATCLLQILKEGKALSWSMKLANQSK